MENSSHLIISGGKIPLFGLLTVLFFIKGNNVLINSFVVYVLSKSKLPQ